MEERRGCQGLVIRSCPLPESTPESSIDPRSDISSDDLADVIAAIEDAQEEDYEALDEILQGEFGKDLVTLAPDLVATALLSLWSPEQRIIRKSALGLLVEGTGT
ncbi:hypothetical protein SAMN04487972_12013 [Paracoccus halophilus]|uniref:Uncharacterized protein n=1 Tax=Paracoccus halophilus TaxID=376733 RepID=A0A099EZD3_9RHOB|nr:hypothetical protein [Paracoccus halophilus]KGJ03282.1 hypothetical protein IT41_14615 [Paracoccus halophilus]SFA58302.1 hypothetical protein SAMN04487972_12013 [Paracoccus halophilus]